jgi:hypothetical protein
VKSFLKWGMIIWSRKKFKGSTMFFHNQGEPWVGAPEMGNKSCLNMSQNKVGANLFEKRDNTNRPHQIKVLLWSPKNWSGMYIRMLTWMNSVSLQFLLYQFVSCYIANTFLLYFIILEYKYYFLYIRSHIFKHQIIILLYFFLPCL